MAVSGLGILQEDGKRLAQSVEDAQDEVGCSPSHELQIFIGVPASSDEE